MIVFGDHSRTCSISDITRQIGQSDPRTTLILAGQIEQALEDDASPWAAAARRVTDCAARDLIGLSRGACSAEAQHLPPATALTVKVPEGYNSYCLYPEQYIAAAKHFAQRERPLTVAVIGIRTIGTGLSAVVAATLAAEGVTATRATVRPNGHPFDRSLDPRELSWLPQFERWIVVDEGPGQSGSSFAAVARALFARDVSPAQVTFFTSNADTPAQASPEIRQLWSGVERVVADWSSLSILDDLRAASPPGLRFAANWPDAFGADYPPFEATKYIAHLEDGSYLLWLFAGLESYGAGATRALSEGSTGRYGINVGGSALHGFIPIRVPASCPHRPTANEIVDFLSPSPCFEWDSPETSVNRLHQAACANTEAILGPDKAAIMESLGPSCAPQTPWTYVDGRMMSDMWRRSNGKVIKLDGIGHKRDHSVIGEQHLLWDVAGAIVELGIPEGILRELNLQRDADLLPFYKASYLAHWAGMARLSADTMGTKHVCAAAMERRFLRYRALLDGFLRTQ